MDENKNRYMLMCEVAEIAVFHGGVVFGGFVRDFLLHEHFAKEFHTKGTESKDMFLVPNDLDIQFDNPHKFLRFKTELTRNGSYKIMNKTGSNYSMFSFDLQLVMQIKETHTHLASKMLIRNKFMEYDKIIPGGNFKVDVVISDTKKDLDFECNGLIMDREGIKLGPELGDGLSPIGKYRRFQQVKDDILKKRAVCVKLVKKRWDKMDAKGDWTIEGEFIKKTTKTDDECIICRHEQNSDYKLGCCNAWYHKECLEKTLKHDNTKCAHCRSDFSWKYEVKEFISD